MLKGLFQGIRQDLRSPVGINGWASFVLTLLCVAGVRSEQMVSAVPAAEPYLTAQYFAEHILAIGFLWALGSIVVGKGKNRLVPALAILLAVFITPLHLAISLMFVEMVLIPYSCAQRL